MRAVSKPKDLYFGIIFLIISLILLLVTKGYAFGTARQMGPGFFPIVLSALLGILSLLLIVRSFAGGYEPVDGIALRPLAFVLGGSLLFGLLLRPAGLVVAVAALVAMGAAASRESKFLQTCMLMAVLAAGSLIVFVYGLGQPIPVLGYWFGDR
jgi:hypothetical protein